MTFSSTCPCPADGAAVEQPVFVPFAVFYLKELFKPDDLWAALAWSRRFISFSAVVDVCNS